MQEYGSVKGWVKGSAWHEFVVGDAVGHCLLMGIGEVAGGGGW